MSSLQLVSEYFQKIESAAGRLEMRDLFASLLQQLSSQEAAMISYLSLGRLTPDFIPLEFQISGKTLQKVIQSITVLSDELFTSENQLLGDLGSVMQKYHKIIEKPLDSVSEMYTLLGKIALDSGKGSQERKQMLIKDLLNQVEPLTAKYVIRILNGKLRLGASDKTILDALSITEPDSKQFAEQLRLAMQYTSDIGHVVYLYKEYGRSFIEKAVFTPGVPVSAKLVEREDTFDSIFSRISTPYIEPKYDGLRLQIHIYPKNQIKESFEQRVWANFVIKKENLQAILEQSVHDMYEVKLYSRNLEEMTEMFPEVIEAAKELPEIYTKALGRKVDTIVLDGEVVGYNESEAVLMTYQETMTRRRKHNIDNAKNAVPVHVFIFDILQVGNEVLLLRPLSQRKEFIKVLHSVAQPFIISPTPFEIIKTAERAEELFTEYVSSGLEGIILKSPESIYEPGVRNFEWIKFKRDMSQGHDLADTLDLVVLGYYFGEGRLANKGVGMLLTGTYEKNTDTFLSVTKVGTKMTDQQRLDIKNICDKYIVAEQPVRVKVPKSLIPDVWLEPKLVIEIEGFEVTKSPTHTSGYAVRFPKFIKFRNKKVEECTSLEELISMVK